MWFVVQEQIWVIAIILIINWSVLLCIYTLQRGDTLGQDLLISNVTSMETSLCYSLKELAENSTIQLFDGELYIFDSMVKKESISGTVYHLIEYNTKKHYAVKTMTDCRSLKQEYDIMIQMKHNYNKSTKALFPFPYNYCYSKENNICLLQMDFITTAEERDDIDKIVWKMVRHKRKKIRIQLIIETLMNCFEQLNASLSILHSFNTYTNDLHPWNILYSYSKADNNIQCHLIDFETLFTIRTDSILCTEAPSEYYHFGLSRLSSYALYHLITPEMRDNKSIELLNKYALMDDTYNLAVIIISEFIQTLNKYQKFRKNHLVKSTYEFIKRIWKLEAQTPDIYNNHHVWRQHDNMKLLEQCWATYNSIVVNIYSLLKNYGITLDTHINKKFECLLQTISANYQWNMKRH